MDTGGGRGFQASPPTGRTAGLQHGERDPVNSFAVRLRLWRNRQIASPRFRALVARLPVLRGIANRKANQLFRLTTGFVHTQILSACVHLGLFEALEGAARSTTAIALRCGVTPDHMRHLLDQARRLDLVVNVGPDLWVLSDAGAVLASERGLREMIHHHDMFYRDIANAEAFWRGEVRETELRRYWAYVRGGAPATIGSADVAPYSALMRESQAMLADCILASHDFGQYRSVLDIGGGEGAFLCAAGNRHPDLKLALFDLPAVTELASRHLRQHGILDRATLHSGDFVTDRIPATDDCVSLIRILCDHDDERALLILSNLHRHLSPGATLIVAEAMAGDSEGPNLAALYFGTYFAAMGSGRCRTAHEIIALLAQCGFHHATASTTTNPLLAGLVTARR
ncbi:methyltransferase [Rhizobium sp. WL3]|nr:methyltransferase [Rhizobium sp. WL3]